MTDADPAARPRWLRARASGARSTGRAGLAGHESHQDHLALYLHNGNEYLEAMLGAFKARVAPFNVNYRYVAEELRYLLADAGARGVVYHSAFAPTAGRGAARRCRRPVACCCRWTTGRATPLLPRRGRVRGRRWRRCRRRRGVGRRVVARRPVHPLHRRHDGDAEGRAVAPGRHLRGRARRRSEARVARADRRAAERPAGSGSCRRRRSCTAPGTGSRFMGVPRRAHDRDPGRGDRARPRRRAAHDRARERDVPADRRRRVRAAAPRRAGQGRVRPVAAEGDPVGRRAAELDAEGPVPRAPAGTAC